MSRRTDRDTIVGIATPQGIGAIGVIRISGPLAVPAASQLVQIGRPGGLEACRPRTLHLATLIDPRSRAELDKAMVSRMPGPSSYTGEDVVEISCHGNPVLLSEVIDILVEIGTRLAEPGEFTRRAYLNGRMDLLQVEAVAELIGARTARAVHHATRQLRGAFSLEVRDVRERVLDLLARLEVALDFPDDESGPSSGEAAKQVGELLVCLDRFVTRARQGRAVHDGLTVALVGAPNVGKSSLLNRLLGVERAIVSPEAGTTRDLVDGTVVFHGVPVRLVDGAGLGSARDAVDAEGMRRMRQVLGESDLALVVLDSSRPVSAADIEVLDLTAGCERMVLANKCDLRGFRRLTELAECECSALTGEGLASIAESLERWVEGRVSMDGEEGGIVPSLRVLERLGVARLAFKRVSENLEWLPLEVALVDLRQALTELDSILGIEADEAILDRIFASFCVGK